MRAKYDLAQRIETLCSWQPTLAETIRDAARERDWFALFARFGRHNAADVFAQIEPCLRSGEYWIALGYAYTLMDTPLADPRMKTWLSSRRPSRSSIMWEQRGRDLYNVLPHCAVQIFRGCRGDEAARCAADRSIRNILGWSWTLSREQALWFATTHVPQFTTRQQDDHAAVLSGQVAKKHIIAVFDDREEAEVLVDPRHVEILDVQAVDMQRR